jgi:hypothetical protein
MLRSENRAPVALFTGFSIRSDEQIYACVRGRENGRKVKSPQKDMAGGFVLASVLLAIAVAAVASAAGPTIWPVR